MTTQLAGVVADMPDPSDPAAASEHAQLGSSSESEPAGGVEVPKAEVAFDLEREVRLAVVLYGGVSLAIYMYGVAEELWRLVRATCPATPLENPLRPPDRVRVSEGESTEPVYRQLARDLGQGVIRSRFVVDIISGTSAGGLNGVFLAAALANNTSLSSLKSIWIDEGGIDVLVNDAASIPTTTSSGFANWFKQGFPPRSLLNGRRMLFDLVEALAKISGDERDISSPLVDELDLWVTSTDLNGLELPIQLSNATTRERRYGNRYRFRFSRKDRLNDFNKQAAPFIAYAARSTSAFPFAFEPGRLDMLVPWGNLHQSWRRFYPDYRNDLEQPFASRQFADGGILDNKPFSYATETLARRHASIPVERKLIYIEPDPAELNPRAGPSGKDWSAIETAAAAFTVPRKEAIRQDLDAVVRRNRALERVRAIIAKGGGDKADRAASFARMAPPEPETFANTTLSQILADERLQWGPSYATYYRLKVANTIDYLALLAAAATGIPDESDEAWAVREVIAAWKEVHYAEQPTGAQETDNAFMLAFGVPYRLRRLMFVYQKLKELQSGSDEVRHATLKASALEPPTLPKQAGTREAFATLRLALADALDALQQTETVAASPDGPIATALAGSELDSATLRYLLEASDQERKIRIDGVVAGNTQALNNAADALRALIGTQARLAREAVDKALDAHISSRQMPADDDLAGRVKYVLRFYYDAFEAYDLVLYPIEYAAPLGETNPVQIIRISPVDAKSLEKLPAAARELMGRRLHHFAGFLDADWRRHDMVWGRLNGAESLIRALAPPASVPSLLEKAQTRILRDYADELKQDPEPSPLEWFARQQPAKTPKPPLGGSLKRAAPVVATILTDIVNKRGGTEKSVWNTLRSILPDKPGGPKAIAVLLVRIAQLKWQAAIALILLPILLLAGIGLIAASLSRSWTVVGVVLVSFASAFSLALLALLTFLMWRIRAEIRKRVGAFLDPAT
jgi:patatin-related protein